MTKEGTLTVEVKNRHGLAVAHAQARECVHALSHGPQATGAATEACQMREGEKGGGEEKQMER